MPVRRQGFDRQTADWLRDAIIAGQFEPEQRLTETAVAKQAGVSRSTARTAFLHLEVEGLVTRQAYASWCVAGLSSRDAWEIFVLRRSMDGLAAQLAAKSITEEGRETLRDALERLQATPMDEECLEFARADISFHSTIVDISQHKRLRQQYDLIFGINLRYIAQGGTYFRHPHGFLVRAHEEIFNAISNGESNLAKSLAEHHVDINGDALVAHLKEQGL